jgi:hypothetical protein
MISSYPGFIQTIQLFEILFGNPLLELPTPLYDG